MLLTIKCLFVWPTLGDLFVSEIPGNVVCLILHYRFLVVHIPRVHMVKLEIFSTTLIPFLTQPCLDLYSFCPNIHHSLIIWLPVSSLSPHNLHCLFRCVLFIFTLTSFVLITFCAAIRRDSVSLIQVSFSLPFPDHLLYDFDWLSLEISIQLFFLPFLFSSYIGLLILVMF